MADVACADHIKKKRKKERKKKKERMPFPRDGDLVFLLFLGFDVNMICL